MKKRSWTLAASVATILAIGAFVFVGPMGGAEGTIEHQGKDPRAGHAAATQPGEAGKACPMCSLRAERAGRLTEAIQALREAAKAADGGNAAAASAGIAKALDLLAPCQEAMKGPCPMCAAHKGGIVNARCPIMGTQLDPAKVPAELTREFRGQKVGFCCGGCPAAWDKLTDQDKQAKLDAAKDTQAPQEKHGH